MALNGTTMGAEVKAALAAAGHPVDADAEAVWKTVCTAIVDHVTANAVVDTTTSGTTASSCTTGGAAGTSSGSGTGTVS